MAEATIFKQLGPQKNYMQIARQIRNMIRDGKLNVGDQLPAERDLVQQFGASRASVREALSALEMLGLIECRGGQGNFIKADGSDGTDRRRDAEDPAAGPRSLRDLRGAPGDGARPRRPGRRARHRGGARSSRRTWSGCARWGARILPEADKQPAIEEYMEEDRKFHLEIGRCAHNHVLFTVFSGVNLMMKETHWRGMKSKGLARGEERRGVRDRARGHPRSDPRP